MIHPFPCPVLPRSYYDELAGGPRHLARSKAISYCEFLEAVGRAAEMVSPPDATQLAQVGVGWGWGWAEGVLCGRATALSFSSL